MWGDLRGARTAILLRNFTKVHLCSSLVQGHFPDTGRLWLLIHLGVLSLMGLCVLLLFLGINLSISVGLMPALTPVGNQVRHDAVPDLIHSCRCYYYDAVSVSHVDNADPIQTCIIM